MTLTADSVEYSAATARGSSPDDHDPDLADRRPRPEPQRPGRPPPGFPDTVRAEWIKFWTVRSTVWSTAMLFVLGAGLTVAGLRDSRRRTSPAGRPEESPGSFVTWGMMIAQITAVVLGALIVTSEYGTGHDPRDAGGDPAARRRAGRQGAGAQLAPCSSSAPSPPSPGTSAGNWFLDREGVGVALTDDGVLRAMFGSGLYLAGLGLFALGVGLLVRHTAAALSIVLALVFVVGTHGLPAARHLGRVGGQADAGQRRVGGGHAGRPSTRSCSSPWVGLRGVRRRGRRASSLVAYLVFRRRDA